MFQKFTLTVSTVLFLLSASAQKDSSAYDPDLNDTMKVGNILIIKMNKPGDTVRSTTVKKGPWREGSKFSTSYMVLDLGFSNYMDETNYSQTGNFLVNRPAGVPIGESDFTPKVAKSRNVNIWLVMQQMAIVKHNLSLKYGLGLELNNYHFKSPLSFREAGKLPYTGTNSANAFVYRDSISFNKNKLAVDYLTVPVMLTFASTDQKVYASVGLSGGYLYSARNKQKSNERGKQKYKDNFELNKFKWSYIAEVGIANYSIYGSYSPRSMFDNNMDLRPFNLGFRFNFL